MEERNKHRGCIVWFNDDSVKVFYGWWTNVIRTVMTYCEEYGLETIGCKWFNDET